MIDGLRSQENKLEQLDFTGSVFGGTFSGLNVFGQASGTFARINNTDGVVYSNGTGSPITYSSIVQGGKAGPLLAATGSIVFGRQFANQTFVVTVSPSESGTLPWSVQSGTTTYTVSGITVQGQSGLRFNWIAAGLV